jgi:hypothetical protein
MELKETHSSLVYKRDNWATKMVKVFTQGAISAAFSDEQLSIIGTIILSHFKTNSGSKELTLENFKKAVSFLYEDKSDSESLADLLSGYQNRENASAEARVLVSKIQQVLNSFFSQALRNEYAPIVVDGIWGQRSQLAYNVIRERYDIKGSDPSASLFSTLENIAKRLVRIECQDPYMLSVASVSAFILCDTDKPSLVYSSNHDGAFLYDSDLQKNILKLNRLVLQDPKFANDLDRFAQWYMILRMRKTNPELVLGLDEGNEFSIRTNVASEFIIPVEMSVDFSQINTGILINVSKTLHKGIQFIAMLFKGDFTFQTCKVTLINGGEKLNIELPSEYNGKADYLQNDNMSITPQYLSDFVKVFVVKESSEKIVPALPSVENVKFSDLISLPDELIISSFNIGLHTETSEVEVVKAFQDKWVMVVGTGDDDMGIDKTELCHELARELAKGGYGLLTGGWQGVDKAISSEFCSLLEENGIDAKYRCKTYVERTNRQVNPSSSVVQLDRSQDWYEETLNVAGALIIIGGNGGSYRAYKAAVKMGVPVVPLGGTGGDALRAFKDMKRNFKELPLRFDMLNADSSNFQQAPKMIDLVMTTLTSFKFPEVSISLEAFKNNVRNVYAGRPVTVEDDLQKNRWGGRSKVDNKELSAKVSSGIIPGFYDIEISLTFPLSDRKEERVAFFIHDSFNKEVVYKKAVNGVAITSQRAYESFTIGAYTEEGTILELDLNEVEGYPKGFYYKSISKEFKTRVEQLYKSTPVVVKDDLQKNRWGRLSTRNGKSLSAKVEKGMPGVFKVTLEVNSIEGDRDFSGEVAFFIHDTFSKVIRYKRTRGGVAKLELSAYESFALGAYLSDGTMLELDLQEVPGYPKGFYYK